MKIKKDFIQLSILFSAAILLIAFSSNAKSGAADGLKMAMEIVVPSLLPLLIIFNLISNAETKRLVETALAPIAEKCRRCNAFRINRRLPYRCPADTGAV